MIATRRDHSRGKSLNKTHLQHRNRILLTFKMADMEIWNSKESWDARGNEIELWAKLLNFLHETVYKDIHKNLIPTSLGLVVLKTYDMRSTLTWYMYTVPQCMFLSR